MSMPEKRSGFPYNSEVMGERSPWLQRALCYISRSIGPTGKHLPNSMPAYSQKIGYGYSPDDKQSICRYNACSNAQKLEDVALPVYSKLLRHQICHFGKDSIPSANIDSRSWKLSIDGDDLLGVAEASNIRVLHLETEVNHSGRARIKQQES